jgi:hypothetical protein
MRTHGAIRLLALLVLGQGALALASGPEAEPPPDPAAPLPMEQIAPELRGEISEVIEQHHFHHRGQPETFPCHPKVYLSLLNEPSLTLALWQDLSPSPARLQPLGNGLYQGTDGNGTQATWQIAHRSPRLHVLFCRIDYKSPRGPTRLEGRVVLIVRTNYYKEASGSPWIQHDIEAYAKIDSKGWRAVARTVKPLIERLLEDQIQEAGWFVSLMGRLVENYPDWAAQVAAGQAQIHEAARYEFRTLVLENRHPMASSGRPALVTETSETVRR